MSKPLIGVMPLWDEGKKSIWMLPGYLEGIREAGGTPVIFPLTEDREELEQLCSLCNGFLITGGQDVDPAIYRETPIPQMGEICTVLDQMERQVLEYAIKEDKAVLGICRGIQYLNAMLGGSLYQDLNVQHPSGTNHRWITASSVVAGNRTWCEQLSSSGSKNSCAIADCDGRIRRRTGGSCLYAEKNLCVGSPVASGAVISDR